MKKAVVLLITLSVISVLSLIVLSNLDLINNLIEKKQTSKNLSAAVFISKDINNQILEIVKNNKEDIDNLLDEQGLIASFDLSYEDNALFINYLQYHYKNYSIKKDIQSLSQEFYRYLKDNNYITIKNKKIDTDISNYKQLNYIISDYLAKNEDNIIEGQKNNITYKDEMRYTLDDEDNEKDINYYECVYTFSYQGISYSVEIIFDGKKGEVIEYKIWN